MSYLIDWAHNKDDRCIGNQETEYIALIKNTRINMCPFYQYTNLYYN